MFHHAASFFAHRGDMLLQGRIDEILPTYCFPMVLDLADRRMIVRGPSEAQPMLATLREALLERGVFALRPKVTALDLPRRGRFRVWVDWQELALPVEGTRMSSVIYYCRQGHGRLQTEMLEYRQMSMPELAVRFQDLALTA
jgi:hypothetical protein